MLASKADGYDLWCVGFSDFETMLYSWLTWGKNASSKGTTILPIRAVLAMGKSDFRSMMSGRQATTNRDGAMMA